MKIRKKTTIKDRIKICLILIVVLGLLLWLALYKTGMGSYEKESTIEAFLQIALRPVGSTMYIWGGGWDGEDNQAGTSSTKIGVSPQWETFACEQDKSYNFNNYRFEREKGLDCSGYVGWVVYNTFEKEDGQRGYVTRSTDMAESFAGRGWGRLIINPKMFLPGDIVSMEGHVWICLGTCEDGSVLLVHSSPPGISVCGTPAAGNQEMAQNSIAINLALEYMTKYHPQWQEKYPNREVSHSYLKNVSVFRWSQRVMKDAERFQSLRGEEIFAIIGPEIS